MGEREGMKIPVINLRGFLLPFEKLREAGEEWGCFRVLNHGILEALMGEMKAVVRSLLDLPMEAKKKNEGQVVEGSGHKEPTKANPLYECWGLDDMGSAQAVDVFCSQSLASPHQRSMGLSSGLFENWACQLWMNKYSFIPESVGSAGAQLHTDEGFLAILQDDDTVSGLQMMDKSGSFVPIDPCSGTFLVILGDMAEEGRAWASMGAFLLGPKQAAIEAPKELVDAEHPRLYGPLYSYGLQETPVSWKIAHQRSSRTIPSGI
ncbi:hypothetical protein EUGRSUZ_L02728 [Eucalyptus grandis]|uniref:Non-haem dioxygenase N-terminal domain-containing protein n=1 Tax=Eucalyptus grandis TaxID=71139 RepID=A0AAD9T970_EUCGR|nr:hypothetical protein EUGRSUZ_L02728 [Eucalyptus grandis]